MTILPRTRPSRFGRNVKWTKIARRAFQAIFWCNPPLEPSLSDLCSCCNVDNETLFRKDFVQKTSFQLSPKMPCTLNYTRRTKKYCHKSCCVQWREARSSTKSIDVCVPVAKYLAWFDRKSKYEQDLLSGRGFFKSTWLFPHWLVGVLNINAVLCYRILMPY